jgi:chalcone isomerase-like protein
MKLVSLVLILTANLCMAAELYDVKLPDSDTVNGKNLVLNGITYREVSVLGILVKVYVGGLYVEKKSKEAEQILNSSAVKQVKTIFKHRASAGDIRNAWSEAFETVCKKECATQHKDHIAAFNKLFDTVKSGEALNYTFTPTGVEVFHDATRLGTAGDQDFAKVVLGVWIGKDAISDRMRKEMLSL